MLKLGVFRPIHIRDLTPIQRSRIIRCSMFVKLKYTPSNVFIKCKARLVGGGNLQDKSLYDNISSPTATPTSVLFVCGDAAKEEKKVASMDIGAAYLNAYMAGTGVDVDMTIDARLTKILVELDGTIKEFVRSDGTVCVRLIKALYGTVEAARLWYDLITKVLLDYGFVPNKYERCVLNKTTTTGLILTVVLYVDDLLVTCKSEHAIIQLKEYLETKFPEVSYHCGDIIEYVGMTIDFASRPGAAVVTMKQITQDIIDTSEVQRSAATPATADLFTVTESQRLSQQREDYFRKFVAKILYLAKRARPDVLLPTAFLTTRATVCTEEDMTKLVRLIGYIKATPDRGIVVEFGNHPRLRSYIDAAYGIHERDGKSHTGGSLVFGKGGPLYVTSAKQSIVTKSSTESELVAFSDVSSEVVCLRNFAIAQGYPVEPAIIYQDNISTMHLIDNGGPCSKRSRHIDIRHFWVMEKIADGSIEVQRCPTEVMWANVLTKPVQGAQFIVERQGLTNWDVEESPAQ